ncbi:N-acetyl-gamma-glutamyl-phosphate reductase [Luteitalea sp. TBR-22]|uniref:N-acetyl-gamma-glutamyl-phosphate reductase n=1 Tax=Luteitalea sp. TBR-22 TaxID=2802971 RepID=UPI001AFC19FC|nr:N-acetyl-gamma-glutamyl-phosphate reductase [Luteitalea sp. TBR-22]BCS31592.1 N-acetyl-gamma-glutamyl-phosphate reductase [Luteitalea sp. TBR-22]
MTDGQQRIGVGVVGATGYGGQELVRLLARHPRALLKAALGSSQTEQPRRLPALARIWDGEITGYSPEALAGCDVVFLSTPEAFAATSAAELLARGHRVIDLSGAFRLKDPALRGKFYPATPDPLPDGTLYSLPEFDGPAVPAARLVSCPGCYPTAALLSLLPLTRAGLLQGDVIVDAKSGISGAGKGASERTHFSENHGSVAAYSLFGHRHTPEMEQALGLPVTFTPHLVPLDRGILSTTYARLKPGVTAAQVADTMRAAYAHAFFVRLTGDRLPEIKHVAHTNFCDIGWKVDEATGRLIVVAVLDNLLKGAAGQALQQFNLLHGFPEAEGLL